MQKKTKKKKNQDLVAKIASLIIAIILWSYVMTIENPDETRTLRNIRINYTNIESLSDQGNTATRIDNQTVNVVLSGKKKELEQIRPDNVKAYVDLEGYSPGQQRVPIVVTIEGSSADVMIAGTNPSTALVEIERINSKEYEVKIDHDGNLPEGYVLGDIASPKVKISGPTSQIAMVRDVITKINLTDKTDSFTVSNTLSVIDQNGEELVNLRTVPESVNIVVPVYKTVVLPIELETSGNLPVDYETTKMSVNPPSVSLKIINKNVEIPKTIKTSTVGLEKLINMDQIELKLELPEGFDFVDKDAVYTLNYDIEKFTEKDIAIDRAQINIISIPDGLEIDRENMPQQYALKFRGYESEINKVSPSQITFEVDASESVVGNNSLRLKLKPLDFKSITLVDTPLIEIPLKEKEVANPESNEEQTSKENSDENKTSTEENSNRTDIAAPTDEKDKKKSENKEDIKE